MRTLLKIVYLSLLLAFIASCTSNTKQVKYEPTFESLEQVDPVPEWFKDAKFGIYFHWGVYSVPAYANEWYPRNMYFPGSNENTHHIATYGEIDQWPYDKLITGGTDKNGNFVQFAPKLKSEGGNFDPAEWAQLFEDAGAKFAGPVAEHHDGFSMWASKINPWNASDMGPKLDLVGLLSSEIRKHNMKVILSMHHAYNITGFYEKVPPTDDLKLQMLYGQQGKEKNEELWLAKHKEIIDTYQPDIIWQDFNLNAISEPVLLQFLAYYYNKAEEWGKPVVASYKDALNTKCAVLDFERGGPTDLTQNYWLTDDAISSSSWCYTEGIGYYSAKQELHGFFDRVSKNGNLLLNISPKADGTIPQEQRDVLLAMGNWLKKYGEAIYSTRAWEKYGEGPTIMGAAHGVFTAPAEGTAKDIRYTRSKDHTTLYAILLGWDKGQKEVKLTSLSSDRIDLSNLKEVSLMKGEAGKYLPLSYKQDETGLIISLPEKSFDELAYALKLSFDGTIPALNKYVEINAEPHYFISPNGKPIPVLGANGLLSKDRKVPANQWALKMVEKGIYRIISRENPKMVLTDNSNTINASEDNGAENQLWKIESYFNDLLKITNIQSGSLLSIDNGKAIVVAPDAEFTGWKLLEVCESKPTPYKKLIIPGIVEVEDFNLGCSGDTYYDFDDSNAGGKYRPDEGVDIEVCSAGGYNTGWAKNGEWMTYTVNVTKSGSYKMTIYAATVTDESKMHVEIDDVDKSGIIEMPNSGGYQIWEPVSVNVQLNEGKQIMKIYIDNASQALNLDKVKFE
ncbi:MAG: alpha-L-fucosidase [Prolixibacteraceae bacterium]|jgi:alpha-L-fucosidase|nr:alpha-L-fucosidase [Prolixibacteraceae bacterium]